MFDGHDANRIGAVIEASVDDAIRLIRAAASTPVARSVPLRKAHGRVLFDAVTAKRDQPPFDASAMDGYAVSDPPSPGDTLRIIGESQAGKAFAGVVAAGQAVRIFTGAPVPVGAIRITLQENVERTGDRIHVRTPSSGKPHIRPRGHDFRDGDVLLKAGERLDAGRLSLAAAAGAAHVTVARKPRIGLICTGDELVEAGRPLRADQIYESNACALKALVKDWGGKAVIVRCRDDRKVLTHTLKTLDADLIVTIGGASVGDYDLVKPVLSAMGIVWAFDKVNIKPGRPTAFGRLPDGRCVLSLPGNPAAALICAHLFLQPFIAAMLGEALPNTLPCLPLAEALPANGPREAFLRARIVHDVNARANVRHFNDQESSAIAAFAQAHVLIRRPPFAPSAQAADLVNCLFLKRP